MRQLIAIRTYFKWQEMLMATFGQTTMLQRSAQANA
jgi:hypothetical protein